MELYRELGHALAIEAEAKLDLEDRRAIIKAHLEDRGRAWTLEEIAKDVLGQKDPRAFWEGLNVLTQLYRAEGYAARFLEELVKMHPFTAHKAQGEYEHKPVPPSTTVDH